MEIKATLLKPFTEEDKIKFIVENNHKLGYIIEEVDNALQAWDLTEEEKAEYEKQRISMLKLTKREVFLALYKDKGITPAQIKAQIPSDEALIEFEYANEYYRGNPLIDMVGILLGYTKEQLDYLFENKEFPPTEENSETE